MKYIIKIHRGKKLIDVVRLLSLTSVLFAGATLYSDSYYLWYVGIVLIISICSVIYLLNHTNVIVKLMNFKFTWWIVILYLMYLVYGVVLPKYYYFNLDYIIFIFITIVNMLILFYEINKEKLSDIYFKSCYLASILICIFVFFMEKESIFSGGIRIGESASGNVTTLSAYLGILSLPCLYKYLYEKNNKYLYVYCLQVIFMLLTGSKKSLVFIVIGIGMFLILKNGIKLHKYMLPSFIVIIAVIFVLNNKYFYGIIGFRIIDFLSEIGIAVEGANHSYSTSKRIIMISSGWKAFLDNPIFGGGWYYFSYVTGLGVYSHNNFVELAVTYGLFGLSWYYSIYIIALKKLFKKLKEEELNKLFITVIVCILISDNTGITFSQYALNYIMILLACIYLKNGNNSIKINGSKNI